MPTPALLLLIATLIPFGSFALLLFVGKRMERPLAGVVGTVCVAASLSCSVAALAMWLNVSPGAEHGAGNGPYVATTAWLPADGAGHLDVGIYVDSLTVAMFAMITLVATLVHIFSLGYMADDKRFPLFFTYLSLFCFAMLGLVIAGTMVQVFIFWELVGLCSYLLIGFWSERKPATDAAIKAFVMNRVGDIGFLVGFGILFYHLGNASLPQLWAQLGGAGLLQAGGNLTDTGGPSFSYAMLTAAGVCLFVGAMGKSAQFPLHTWLADAMEGPTPVSALIHAATMVAAGVYFVGRMFPILTPDAKLFVAIIGVTTLTMGALIAVAQHDIKRVLAYSTVSQLGYMMLAIGVGSWVGALFHLVTHAFFKSLLFLSAGSVIHATHHEQDLRQFGGLYKRLPITAMAFGVGVLAIAGTPFLSGYYSKSMILTHAAAFGLTARDAGHAWGYWLLFILPTAVAYLTAFYMARCWVLTFVGRPRNVKLYNVAEETWVMYTPLIALAVMAIIAGRWIGVVDLLKFSIDEAKSYCQTIAPQRAFHGFDTVWPVASAIEVKAAERIDPNAMSASDAPREATEAGLLDAARSLEATWTTWAFAVGLVLAGAVYVKGFALTDRLFHAVAPLDWVRGWLARAMYFDELYTALVVGVTRGFATFCDVFDRYVIDGIVNTLAAGVRRLGGLVGRGDDDVVDGAVAGVAALARDVGAAVRAPQTGRVRAYVTTLMLLAAVGVAVAVVAMVF